MAVNLGEAIAYLELDTSGFTAMKRVAMRCG